MVGSNKILTVSYGTFSCTLEGFDDPFSAMRSIAEYFRDLAADDRYFGAEPPTPDAEMLHRIAEREVQRRVEARVQGDGVVLRQLTDREARETGAGVEAAATPAMGDAPEGAREAVAPEASDEAIATEGREETADAAEDHAETIYGEEDAGAELDAGPGLDPDDAADAAEELAAETEPEAADAEPADEVAADMPEVAAVAETPETDAEAEIPDPEATDASEIVATAEDEAPAADEAPAVPDVYAEDDEAADDRHAGPAAAPATVEMPDAEDTSVAAKLSRIRAVVAGDAEGRDAAPSDFRFAGSIQTAFSDSDAIEDAEFTEVTLDAPSRTPPAASTETSDAGLAAKIVMLKRMAEASDTAASSDAGSSLSDSEEAELARELEEAEREDRENLFAENFGAGEPDLPEDDETLPAVASAAEHETEASEDPETAEAETDAGPETASHAAPASDGSETPAVARRSDILARHPGFDTARTEEAAFDRILEQTNTRMDDSEGSRRRSAIAHLKAAVAATKADRLMKRPRSDEAAAEEQSQYRDDLAKVVQPRRPLTEPRDMQAADDTADPGPEPTAGTPAPLVLASEQRVDTLRMPDASEDDADENAWMDARPEPATASAEEGFAEFAARMGASDLPDLLEAAAAYTAFVEGNRLFSRPELMRRVAHMASGEDFTREAGLRSFGQLLRQGKIQKLKRGQFTIPEETRFNPEARLAGE